MAGLPGGLTLPYQLFFTFALGTGARPALEPFVQSLANEAWTLNAVVPPPALYLAEGVAQGQVARADAYSWAKEQGFDTAQMDAMVAIANTGPALELAYRAWRRGHLTDAQFTTALRRQGIESQWFSALQALKGERLTEGAIATAVHRGIMDDAGLLVTTVPTGPGNVPRIPVSPLDTLKEFEALGIDPERARVLVADTGLPLSLGEMLALLNRGKVTPTDVQVSIAESNVRNEYMDVALDLARRLLTPHEYAESELRGILTTAEAEAGAALSGLNTADYQTLFGIMGRPLNVHEITTGQARGGTYGGTYNDVPAGPYRDAIRRSAIRPEYASIAYANRYTFPSAFVLRALAQAGDLGDEAAVVKVLEETGWQPAFATKVAAAWMGGSDSSDPHVAKAQTRAWTDAQNAYLKDGAPVADVEPVLTALNVSSADQQTIVTLWDAILGMQRKQLSVAQIKKAYRDGDTNPATGLPWDTTAATARLAELGYNADDIKTILEL